MRNCAAVALALLAIFSLSLPDQVFAQGAWVGVGPTFPTGDYADWHNTGFTTVAGVGFPVGPEGLGIFAEGYYGQNSIDDDDYPGAKTSPFGIMGGASYSLNPEADAGLYVFGQAGLMVHRWSADNYDSETDNGFAFSGGAGYGFPIGGFEGFVEGRYTHGRFSSDEYDDSWSTAYFSIVAGVYFPLGGE